MVLSKAAGWALNVSEDVIPYIQEDMIQCRKNPENPGPVWKFSENSIYLSPAVALEAAKPHIIQTGGVMMGLFDGIYYLAVLVAAVLSFLLGWLWYSPMLFGKAWMTEMGMTKESMDKAQKEGIGKMMAMGFLIAFLTAFYLAHYIAPGGDMMHAIKWGLFAWIGLVVTTNASDYIWGKRSMKLFIINMTHHAVVIVMVCILFTLWK